jgi:BirA family transcriptional regulator, biotin operon repressor / biotin---[acetyl-CoA-carboxylase] ligase
MSTEPSQATSHDVRNVIRVTGPDALDVRALREDLVAPHGPYAALDVVASTGSTNADLLAAAGQGAADRTVLIADTQTAGRGRRDRSWASPPGTGLYLSVLLRPAGVPVDRLGTLGMVAGLALLRVATDAGVAATLKWPNDLLVGDAKCAGVLSEAVPDGAASAAVVGVGLNVGPLGHVPAGPGGLAATSLAEHGATTGRGRLALGLLRAFAELEQAWRAAGGDVRRGVLAGYREACGTIGRRVRAELPGGESRTGVAIDVDPGGRLLIRLDDGTVSPVSAGDVVHLRTEDHV